MPNLLPTLPTFDPDLDFTPSHDSLESGNKISDPGIFIEVQSERLLSWDGFSISFIHDPLCPVFDLLLLFSSKNEDKVFNPGILISPLLSHRGEIISNFSKSPMMIFGGDIPHLDVLIPQDHEDPCLFSILQSSGLQSSPYYGILNPDHFEQEVAEKEVSAADPVTTAGEVVTTASATTTVDELTLAQTLIEIKAAKPKAVTTAATTITTVVASTRPKAKGIVFHDQEEQASAFTPIVSSSQLPQAKDKGKGKMVEPEKPLKKKDQIALDEELALRLHAKEQAELEKERVAQEEASRAAIIEELDSIQAMIEADEQLAARLQAEEQEQFSIEEKSRMLVEMIAERKKFFAAQRAAEQRSKPPTKLR
ncbi:hypothetical protein Tco_0558357 [Tanacetum coccineum]